MMNIDKESLLCDLAETYRIYDYKSLPVSRVAIYSIGLRENSRIKMKMAKMKWPLDTLLLAAIADRLSVLVWMKTKDGAAGINRPESILNGLLGKTKEHESIGFESPEEFEKAKRKILKGEL